MSVRSFIFSSALLFASISGADQAPQSVALIQGAYQFQGNVKIDWQKKTISVDESADGQTKKQKLVSDGFTCFASVRGYDCIKTITNPEPNAAVTEQIQKKYQNMKFTFYAQIDEAEMTFNSSYMKVWTVPQKVFAKDFMLTYAPKYTLLHQAWSIDLVSEKVPRWRFEVSGAGDLNKKDIIDIRANGEINLYQTLAVFQPTESQAQH